MSMGGGIVSAANCPHEPGDAKHSQYDKGKGKQPHEEHAAHHPRAHHSPPWAIAPTTVSRAAQQACAKHQDEQGDNADYNDHSPINFVHQSLLLDLFHSTRQTLKGLFPGQNLLCRKDL